MIKKHLHKLLLASALVLIQCFGYAQQFQFKNYSVGEGLAQSQVYSILEDSKGYIWMGTRGGGISRFDGFNFNTFTTKDGLISNYIWTLFEDSKQRIWIGTSNGVCVYSNNQFTEYTTTSGEKLISGIITETKDQSILIGSDKGLFKFQDSVLVPYHPDKIKTKTTISALHIDHENALWVGSDNGLFIFKDEKVQRITTRHGLNSNLIRAIEQNQDNLIFVGTYGKGINVIKDLKVNSLNNHFDLNNTIVTSLYNDTKNQLWATTSEQGVLKLNLKDTTLVQLSEKNGLANNHTRTIEEDRWGNYWVGTSGGGVSKYTGQQFEYISKSNGLPGNYIYSISFDLNNQLWIGTSGLGITKLDSGQYITFNQDSGFANVKVRAIHHSVDGLLWIGTEGQGLYYYDKSSFRNLNALNGLSGNYIKDIKSDDSGNIWVATAGGGITKITTFHSIIKPKHFFADDSIQVDSLLFNQYDTIDYFFTFDRYNTKNGLSSNRINQLLFDGYGRCWYATQSNGLGRIDEGDTIVNYSTSSGLSGNSIRSICEDFNGNLWAGTGGKGLNRLSIYEKKITIDHFDMESGIQSDNIYQLIVDKDNFLWVGSEKGVDKLKLSSTGEPLEIKHFGKNDGFIGVETSLNAVTIDTIGNTWFGTINGISKYLSKNQISIGTPPVLSFSNVELNYVPVEKKQYQNKTMVLKHSQNQISFDFIGIMQTNPEKVKYQWLLEGLEKNWSPVSSKQSITYSNLLPGDYTFWVKASNDNNLWSEPIQVKFHIKPPIWQEWWFKAFGVIFSLLFISGIVVLRIRTIKKKAAREKQQILMEKELLLLEQKALRLQMNPHFIFNALNTIQALVSKNDSKTARYYLAKFSKLMRQILDNSRQTSIPLEHELVTLENYLAIEQFCHNNRFDFKLEIDEEIDTEFVQIPPMLLQPFIENSIIHGVSQMKEKGLINISFKQVDELMICSIEDNGIGREKASEMKSQKDQHHKSTALIVTQERLDILNENAKESIQITDLYHEDQSPRGTRVTVKIKSS